MNELEALRCLEQLLDTIRPLAQKASDPFGPDILYAEDVAEQITLEQIEQCSTAIGVLRQLTKHMRGSGRTDETVDRGA